METILPSFLKTVCRALFTNSPLEIKFKSFLLELFD